MKETLPYLLPFALNAARYFLMAGIPFLIFYILFPKVFSKNKIQDRFARQKDFLREICHSMQTTLIIAGVGLLILKTPLKEYTRFYDDLSDYASWWIPVSVVLALVIHDTYFYWMHRAVHHPKLFRRVHLLHHKSVNPSPWASYSFHFFEGVLEAMIAPILLFFLPMHPLSLVLFTFLAFGINVYGHLGYEIAPRWFRHSFLFKILNTSIHHNMHHEKFKGNYGLYFRAWDRLMGTEHPDYVKKYDEIQARRFGNSKSSPLWRRAFLLMVVLAGIGVFTANAQTGIEGKWKDHKNGGTILIYEEDGLYFGQVVAADNAVEHEKIQAHGKVMVLKNFKKENETKFCCGTIFSPRRKKTLSGELILEDENTLKINGSYGVFKGSQIWVKL